MSTVESVGATRFTSPETSFIAGLRRSCCRSQTPTHSSRRYLFSDTSRLWSNALPTVVVSSSVDGCSAAGAVNYHLEANFLSAYLTARGQQISANASADGVSMTQFNTDLGSATTLLSSIGTNAYQNGQQGQLYGLLAKAGSDLQKCATRSARPTTRANWWAGTQHTRRKSHKSKAR